MIIQILALHSAITMEPEIKSRKSVFCSRNLENVWKVFNSDNSLEINKMELYSISGALIDSNNNSNSIDISFFPTGIYLLKAISDKGDIFIFKLIK